LVDDYAAGRSLAQASDTSMKCIWPVCTDQLFIPSLDSDAGHQTQSDPNQNLNPFVNQAEWSGSMYTYGVCPVQPCQKSLYVLENAGTSGVGWKQYKQDCGNIGTFVFIEAFLSNLTGNSTYIIILFIMSLLLSITFRSFYKFLYKENPIPIKMVTVFLFSVCISIGGLYLFLVAGGKKVFNKLFREIVTKKSANCIGIDDSGNNCSSKSTEKDCSNSGNCLWVVNEKLGILPEKPEK